MDWVSEACRERNKLNRVIPITLLLKTCMVSTTNKKKKWTRKSPEDGSRKQINDILTSERFTLK